ncbi:MAG: hypothetical protein SPL49_05735 [Oribacterium sp.]|jgi:FMN phosphatase YigB (HAD superfamily)|nr:hypothetical protein [Oribacterium sp.]MDY6306686.1 hypothetical protein [Oribacterium sp.]MDY6316703.1 hypothetical protein [Oribacterium sp.]
MNRGNRLFLSDWGGVVEHSPQWDIKWANIAKKLNAGDPMKLRLAFYADDDQVEKVGEEEARAFLVKAFRKAGYTFTADEFIKAHREEMKTNTYREDVAAYLEKLTSEHDVGIFSDVGFLDLNRQNRQIGIGKVPYRFVFQSLREGCCKYHGMDGFRHVDEVVRGQGYEYIFFADDNPANLEKAERVGWETLLFNDRDALTKLETKIHDFFDE